MKKKTLTLTIIFLISIFMFNSKVNAAKEMTCVYNGSKNQNAVMFIQDKDGKQELYCITTAKERENASLESKYWTDCTDGRIIETKLYILPLNNEIKSCPKGIVQYVRIDKSEEFLEVWACLEEDSEKCKNSPKLTSETYSVERPNTTGTSGLKFYYSQRDDYKKEIDSTKWKAKCAYSKYFDLYINNEKMIIYPKNEKVDVILTHFSTSKILDYMNKSKNTCPPRIYYYQGPPGASNGRSFFLNKEEAGTNYQITLVGDETEYYEGTTNNEPQQEKINSCKDLFSDTFRAKILQFLNIIKIAVPIMLIALGTVDFAKAVFSGNADEMKKSQKTFIKRLIASVLVFLVPVFVNLILTLANKVWSYISPEACIDVEEE